MSERMSHNLRLPPGPHPYPIIGNLHLLSLHLYRDFEKLLKKYGPLMYLKIGAVPVVVVQNAALAREITKTHDLVLAYRPQDMAMVKILFFQGDDIGFSPINDHWRFMRKLLATQLYSPKTLSTFKNQRHEEMLAVARAMMELAKRGEAANVYDQMKFMMYNVMTRMLAGKTFYGSKAVSSPVEQERFRTLMDDFFGIFNTFNIGDWFPYLRVFGDFQGLEKRMTNVATRLERFNQDIIDEHRRRKSTGTDDGDKDFVDMLLDLPGENGGTFGDRNIRIILQSSLIAGTETTSSTIQWALAELIRHPELLKKLQIELDSVVGRDRLVEESDLPQLKLLGAIVKETLRLHPAGPFLLPRQPIANCRIAGYDIPTNVLVFVSIWAILRDPTVWERPLEFLPERFLDSKRDFIGSSQEYIPFGAGRRTCPGLNIGVLVVQHQLAHLVHLCNFSSPEDGSRRAEDMDMTESPGFNIPRRVPLKVLATPRLASHFYETHLDYKC